MTGTNIAELVNQLTNTLATSNSLGQLGVRVDLQRAGHRSACMIETGDNTWVNLGNTTTIVPNPNEYTDLRVSPLQGAAASLVMPNEEMVLITYTNPSNDFTPVNGYAFSVGRDGNITAYQTITIDFLRNTVTKTSERTECPAIYREHVGKLISETYTAVQKTVETRANLLKHCPELATKGYSPDSVFSAYVDWTIRDHDVKQGKLEDVKREVNQLKSDLEQGIAQQKVSYSTNDSQLKEESKHVVTEPQSHTALVAQPDVPLQSTNSGTNYYGIGSALVIGALLGAIVIKKFYHKK